MDWDERPHTPRRLKLRIAIELIAIAGIVAVVFVLRARGVQNSVAWAGVAMILFPYLVITRRETNAQVWGLLRAPAADRWRGSARLVGVFTLAMIALLLVIGVLGRALDGAPFRDAAPMVSTNFLLALAAYLPWTLVQETLLQFYLQGRLRVILPGATPAALALVTGVFYGAVHLGPTWGHLGVAGVSTIAGVVWSYAYQRYRVLIPIAVSHALLASTWYYWIYGRDVFHEVAGWFR
jgi:hypothetical protein